MNFLKNYISTIVFIFIVYFFYSNTPYYQDFLSGSFRFSFYDFGIESKQVFMYVIYAYIVLLIPFYLFYKDQSKARIIIGFIYTYLQKRRKIKAHEKTAVLAWIVKAFFAPLMIFWLTEHIFNLLNNIYNSYTGIELLSTNFLLFFNSHFFWLAFTTILFFDVLLFTLGYLIEMPLLKNKIKSVEPTMTGWVVALICYPPFNSGTSDIIGWYSSEFPQFGNPSIHLTMNIAILILMGIYSRASISLGFKASNLTNRGIVRKGPYKIIRHPAYICKNLSWWIGGLPIIIISLINIKESYIILILSIASLSAWTLIYYLRAITEERHLSLDPDYIKYKKEVPYKFIPKIW